jgi:hypothetical protein
VETDDTDTFATDVLYTLSFTPKHLIPRSGLLEITVPSQIEIENEVTTSENIWVVFGGEAEQKMSIVSIDNKLITIGSAFLEGDFDPDAQTLDIINVKIQGLTNPSSVKPTDSFIVTTAAVDGNRIDSAVTGLEAIMSTVGELSGVNVQPTSKENGFSTDYTFNVIPPNSLDNTDIFTFGIPSEVTFPTNDLICTPG